VLVHVATSLFFINLFKTSTLALLEYIKDQLLFNDTVTLPGLGSFAIRKTASHIQGRKIMPPSVQVVFDKGKSFDDGVLAKSVAAAEDISQEEAVQKVLEYIDDILFALNKGEEYVFVGFGKLYRDSENVFRFEKDPSYKVDFESYGLESFELDPVEELLDKENNAELPDKTIQEDVSAVVEPIVTPTESERVSTVEVIGGAEEAFVTADTLPPPTENKNNRSILWVLTGAVMVILVAFVLVKMTTDLLDGPVFSVFNSEKNDKSDYFPENEDWDLESALNGELGEAIDSMTSQENALTLPETPDNQNNIPAETSEYKEFHIIAGSFKDKENAGLLQQSLSEKGYPALVIQQGEKLYRVSALSFKEKEKGLQELSRFKQVTKNNAAWLLGLN